MTVCGAADRCLGSFVHNEAMAPPQRGPESDTVPERSPVHSRARGEEILTQLFNGGHITHTGGLIVGVSMQKTGARGAHLVRPHPPTTVSALKTHRPGAWGREAKCRTHDSQCRKSLCLGGYCWPTFSLPVHASSNSVEFIYLTPWGGPRCLLLLARMR